MVKIKNYTFNNDLLIKQALTHSSYSPNNYERLEFLGDSLLDFIVAKYFYQNEQLSEGVLTKIRAYYVSENNLCKVFDKLNVENLALIGKSCKKLTNSIKCDMFEAIIGAVYLDGGLDKCEEFILQNIFLEPIEEIQLNDEKTRLQEWAQKNKLSVSYSLLQQSGLAHNPIFKVQAQVGKFVAYAQSGSKQIAERECAKKILQMIEEDK